MIAVIPNQEDIALVFLLIAFVCVPLMLCVKPCAFLCCKKSAHHKAPKVSHSLELENNTTGGHGDHIDHEKHGLVKQKDVYSEI